MPVNFRVIQHDVVDSTNELAFAELAAGRARHGDVHQARAQERGRGRLGRVWASPAGEGLYVSVVLLPPAPPLAPPALTIAAALAVFAAASELGAPDLRLKWPNDLLAKGAKLAGILIETRGLEPERPHYVVGLGVNVRQQHFPPELERLPATSFARLGLELSPGRVRDEILEHLPNRLRAAREDHGSLEQAYLEAAGLTGPVELEQAQDVERGVLERFSIRAGLALRLQDGSLLEQPLELVRRLAPAGRARL